MIEKNTMYYLRCDNCGYLYYDRYGCNEFRNEDDMLKSSEMDGWVHPGDLDFCCEECLEEWQKKNN